MSRDVLKFQTCRELGVGGLMVKVLLYGDSGAGKTHTSVTAPKPCVLLTEPNGILSIQASNPDAIVVDVTRIAAENGTKPMDVVRDFFRAAMDGTLRETGCKTVIIDSLTELQRMLRDEILSQKAQGGNSNVQWTLQDWGTLTDRLRKLVRMIRDLPFHVVATALADADTDQNENRYVVPSFQGKKFPNEIAGYFSLVGYVYRQRIKEADDQEEVLRHKVLFSGPSTYLTKNVAPLEAVEAPNVDAWIQAIQAYGQDTKSSRKETTEAVVDPADDNTSTKRPRRARATSRSTAK